MIRAPGARGGNVPGRLFLAHHVNCTPAPTSLGLQGGGKEGPSQEAFPFKRRGLKGVQRDKPASKGLQTFSHLRLSKDLLEKQLIPQTPQITTELEENEELEEAKKGNRVLIRKASCRGWGLDSDQGR